MAVRGVHFAITPEQREQLLKQRGDAKKIDYVQMKIEEVWDKEHLLETDVAWDGIHRVMIKQEEKGEFIVHAGPEHGPGGMAVVGGLQVLKKENRYMIRLVEAEAVGSVAAAMQAIDEAEFTARYDAHCRAAVYYLDSDEEFASCWESFQQLRDFFAREAGSGRSVIFTVSY